MYLSRYLYRPQYQNNRRNVFYRGYRGHLGYRPWFYRERLLPLRVKRFSLPVKAEKPFNFSTTPAYRADIESYQQPEPAMRIMSIDDMDVPDDMVISEEIEALASQLEYNPVLIVDWVRNNIEHTPGYGEKAGADYTLKTKKGNAFDQATLLIALLRASEVDAKERGRNNFPNYASQLQAAFVRSQIPKILK